MNLVNRSDEIKDVIDNVFAEFSKRENLIPKALRRVLKDRGLNLSERELNVLVAALTNPTPGIITLDLDPPSALGGTKSEMSATLELVVSDVVNLLPKLVQELQDSVANAVPEALKAAAGVICQEMLEREKEHSSHLKDQHIKRTEEALRLWGKAIEALDLLRHLVLEWGSEAYTLRTGTFSRGCTAYALQRLIYRAYEIAGEIVTLARNGYADGALARWRSLHEVCVIAMFLAQRSEKCAEMYLAHHKIEELKIIEVGREKNTDGSRVSSNSYWSGLRITKRELSKKFGLNFSKDYGWASIELGRAKTTFKDIEEIVGLDTLRQGYQRANGVVHGGALAALTRVSLGMGGTVRDDTPPAYGCETPISYSASTLSMVVAELCLESDDLDSLTMSLVVHNHAKKVWDEIELGRKALSMGALRMKSIERRKVNRKVLVKRNRRMASS